MEKSFGLFFHLKKNRDFIEGECLYTCGLLWMEFLLKSAPKENAIRIIGMSRREE